MRALALILFTMCFCIVSLMAFAHEGHEEMENNSRVVLASFERELQRLAPRLAAPAGPPSPAKPAVPLPAIVLIVNCGACPKQTLIRIKLAKPDKLRRNTVIS